MTNDRKPVPLIVAARKARGWSQLRLADELGMAQSRVSEWELGGIVPDKVSASRLAKVLDIPLDDLEIALGRAPEALIRDPDAWALQRIKSIADRAH